MATPVNRTWTWTFSEAVENHVGMQQIGIKAAEGFSTEDLDSWYEIAKAAGCEVNYYNLEMVLPDDKKNADTKAFILIIRNGAKVLLGDNYNNFLQETRNTEHQVDKQAFMRGRVVNKHARWNLCLSDIAQAPNFAEKKGTILAFSQMPYVSILRNRLGEVFGSKCRNLFAELNYYYDNSKCGISGHGDSERTRVVGIRIGASQNLQYQWFHQWKPIGLRVECMLNEGDMYFMSSKAVGNDWKSPSKVTLRHAVGQGKFIEF